MAYRRCPSCRAKALCIATRCPSCGHAFQLRDASGRPVRFRRCSACDIQVPRGESRCPWCEAEWRPLPDTRLVAGGAVAVLLLLGGVSGFFLLAGDEDGTTPSPPPPMARALSQAAPSEDVVELEGVTELEEATEMDGATGPARVADPDVRGRADPSNLPGADRSAPGVEEVEAIGGTVADEADPASPAPEPEAWDQAEAVTFVNVRAGPDREADIVGVVPESAPVLLGDLRRGWRMVRAGDLSGWADNRLFRTGQEGQGSEGTGGPSEGFSPPGSSETLSSGPAISR